MGDANSQKYYIIVGGLSGMHRLTDYPGEYTSECTDEILRTIRDTRYFPARKVPVTQVITKVAGDMKAGLVNGKPQLSQMPHDSMVYCCRAFEYGNSKYDRGNYLRKQTSVLEDFIRLLGYLDAELRHLTKITLEMNRALGCTDKSDESLRAAAATIDPESGLPHLCGMLASGTMAVQQAVDSGLIPKDPGRPWEKVT